MQASLAITTLDIDGEEKTIVVRLSVLLCCIKRRIFVDQQIVIPETFVGSTSANLDLFVLIKILLPWHGMWGVNQRKGKPPKRGLEK
jgi:hypothetical protein